jgi:uncharacterized protein YegL
MSSEQKRRVAAAIVLDASGSMQRVQSATISGVNEWLDDQKRDTSSLMDAMLVLFSSHVQGNLTIVPIATMAPLTPESYQPRGNTALLDAMGMAIRQLESHDADAYLVLVVTDGEENASHEFSAPQIRELVMAKERTGVWAFTFLGANIDAWAQAQSLGFQSRNVANYAATPERVQATFTAASVGASRGRRIVTNSNGRDSSGLLRGAGGQALFSTYDSTQEVRETNADLNPGTGRSTTD